MVRLVDSEEPIFIIVPQSYTRLEDWEEGELNTSLQKIIDTKENNYTNNNDWMKNYQENWLLVSDIQNIMGTCKSEIAEFNYNLNSKLFSKVFLIQDIVSGYRIITIKNYRDRE